MFRNIPLAVLCAFESSARVGSFRSAAEELHVSPSAISHAIRKLEASLGTQLFRRTTRKIELTPEGRALFEHARRGFDDLRRGIELVSAHGPTVLRLHSAPSFAAQWLVPRLANFFTNHPRIELRLACGTDYARFEADEFDIDIVYGRPKSTGVVVIPLGEELLTPLCSPEIAKQIRLPDDLLKFQLLQSERKQIRWPTWLEANELLFDTQQGARFDRSFLTIAAAVDGLGVALESSRLAERELRVGRLVRPLAGVEKEIRNTEHYLVFSDATHCRHTIEAFLKWLLTELELSTSESEIQKSGARADRSGVSRDGLDGQELIRES